MTRAPHPPSAPSPRWHGEKGTRQQRMRGRVAVGAATSVALVPCRPPSYNARLYGAGIAQLVERVIRNDEVVGSIPISGTIPLRRLRGRLAQR